MQIEKFGQFKTGSLIPITVNEHRNDYAFSPHGLPCGWLPNVNIYPLIVRATAAVSALNGAGGILPDPALLFSPIQRREAQMSNMIEGTFVSVEEMLMFEIQKNVPNRMTNNDKEINWYEVFAYQQAIDEGCKRIARGDSLNREMICELHKILLSGVRGKDKNPGHFRTKQVYVSGSRYIPSPAEFVESQFDNLEAYFSSNNGDPLVRAFIAHYQFEAIHPFNDGNGRLGRLMLSLCIFKWLGHSHAWLYLSEYFEKNRSEYVHRMFNVSANGDWEEWIGFCLAGTIEQANATLERCKKLTEIKKRYESEFGQLSPRMGLIINSLLSVPYVDAVRLSEKLNITQPTARADILKLCKVGVLGLVPGKRRPKAYASNEIFEIAYGNLD